MSHIPDPAALFAARYGAADAVPEALRPWANGAWNTALAAIFNHRSVRAYRPDPLPAGIVELIAAAGQSAPSSSNLQAWSLVAVEDPGRKSRLAEYAGNQTQIHQAPLFVLWLADLARLTRVGETQGVPAQALDYLESFVLAVIDAALAAQNAVVALESLGLGTVYIGAIRNKPLEVAAELGLPPNILPVFGLCVGWPDPNVATDIKPRLPQSVIVHRERYDLDAQTPGIDAYNPAIRAFQRTQGLAEQDWTKQASLRVRGAEALNGRDRLRTVLAELGFGLR